MLNKPNIGPDKQKIIVYVLLTLAVFAVFWQLNHYDFVSLDDDVYVTANSHLQSGFTTEGLRWALSTTYAYYWHPVTWLSLMLDYKLFGLNAGGYHAINVVIHLFSVLLLFSLFCRMTGEVWKSAFVAAVFALHPLRVESVAWIAKRRDLLCIFFSILALLAYVYYAEKPALKKYAAVLLFFILALASKPMVVTLPVIMILLDYWPLNRFASQKDNKILWQLKEKTALFALSALFSVITIYAHVYPSITRYSLASKFYNALVSFIAYPAKMLWPGNLSVLCLFPETLPLWHVLLSAFLIMSVTTAVIAAAKRMPYLFTGWMWYAITIAPTLNIIQFGHLAMSDHHTYLPSVGLCVMLAWGIPILFSHADFRRTVLFPSAVVFLIILALLTWKQCGYWKNSFELLSHAVEVTKNNYIAHNNLANRLAGENRDSEALAHYNKAISIKPDFSEVYNNRGNVFVKTVRLENALADYNEAIRLKPDYIQAYNNRGILYTRMGLYQKALDDFNKARGLADTSGNAGSTGKEKAFDETLNMERTSAGIYNNRGIVYFNLKQYKQAVDDFSMAASLNPASFEAYYNRGRAFSRMDDYSKALADYEKAVLLNPGNAEVYKSMGTVYFKHGDKKSGCYPAGQACRLGDCELLKTAQRKGLCN